TARKLRRRAVVAAGAAVAALILLVMSVFMWQAAQEQARIAKVQRLAAQSSALLRQYPQRSLLLGVEAVRVPGTRVAAAEQSLREALRLVGGRPVEIGQSGAGV